MSVRRLLQHGLRWCLQGPEGAVVGNDEFLWIVQCTFCDVSEEMLRGAKVEKRKTGSHWDACFQHQEELPLLESGKAVWKLKWGDPWLFIFSYYLEITYNNNTNDKQNNEV